MMPFNDNEIRLQIPVTPETHAKLTELAERMKVGTGRMAAMLLEAGMEDNEWIIRVVTSRWVTPVRAAMERFNKRTRKGGSNSSKS